MTHGEKMYLRGLRDGIDLMRHVARDGIQQLSPEAREWIRKTYAPVVEEIALSVRVKSVELTLAYLGIDTSTPDDESEITVVPSHPEGTPAPPP